MHVKLDVLWELYIRGLAVMKTLPSRFCLVATSIFIIGLAPRSVQAANDSEVTLLQTRIDNFAKVSPTIWRGAHPSDIALEDLANHGVKTIVDLRLDGNNS